MRPLATPSDMHIPLRRVVRRVKIRKYPVSALAASVRADYEAKFGEPPSEPGGWFHPDDWHRVSYVAEVLRPGGDLLDVGAGAGQFLNMLARSGKFRSVVGIDKARFTKYTELEPNMSKLDGDIANLQFEDDSFDVVTCMEVLEHIPPEVFVAGMAELRRVCRGQLIMSVPFCEPEPHLEDTCPPLRSCRHPRGVPERELHVARSPSHALDDHGGALRRHDARHGREPGRDGWGDHR